MDDPANPSLRMSPNDHASETGAPAAPFRPLRVWPALVLVALMFAARYGVEFFEGASSRHFYIPVFGPMLCGLLLIIGWLTFSRATWKERLFGLLGLVAALAITLLLVHPTMRGPGTSYLTIPMGMIAFTLGATLLRKNRPARRTGVALLLASTGFACSLLVRNEGMTGAYGFSMHWRWTPTAEQQMMAGKTAAPAQPEIPKTNHIEAALANPEWPAFRGADRTGHARGPQIATNWASNPPRQLWKIPVGPAWSSFAVAGQLLFTQEQRGPMETVVCYDAATGREVWNRQVETRFDDPLGGPGPRATPTLANGGLFVTGATGTLMRLDPATGAILWQNDLKTLAGLSAPPMWGFSASPLVTGSVVIVYAGGPGDKGLLALDLATGAVRWSAIVGNDSYSSAQLNTIAGEEVVLMLTNEGLHLVDPANGKVRLNYPWKFMGYRALQPAFAGSDTILLPTGMSTGTRAIRITKANGELAAQELWTSRNLKPDFTDFVIHQGHAYGVDAGIFACVELKSGERKWKGGRYGKGQVVLLENSDLLLVAAEDGRVVLLRADPSGHAEVAAFKALEGKTWNHPVAVADRLYLRNAQEAACFVLPLAEPKASVAESVRQI